MIDFDRIELLGVFYEILPLTDEEIGVYFFQATRPDGIKITLNFSVYEQTVGLLVRDNSVVPVAADFSNCVEIRVLDTRRRQLEFSTEDGIRCFIDLLGENIVSIEQKSQ